LSDGRIVLLDAGERRLLFYGADGRFQRAVARAGRGPGEFLQPTWLGRGGDDTLFVWDPPQLRLSTFDAAGKLLSTHRVEGQVGPPAISGRFADGSFLSLPGSLVFYPPEPGVLRLPESYGRFDLRSGRTTVLAEGRSEESVLGAGNRYSLPFGKQDRAAASAGALIVGDNGIPAIRYYDMEGRLRRVAQWVSEPIAVSAEDRSAYARYYAALSPRLAIPADAVFAEERPRFSWISGDARGWVWVKTFSGGWEPPVPWLVFDQDGLLQCEVDAPARVTVLEIGERYLLGLQRDELDEVTVVRYTLVRAPQSKGR
jgi:hypothetical protein